MLRGQTTSVQHANAVLKKVYHLLLAVEAENIEY